MPRWSLLCAVMLFISCAALAGTYDVVKRTADIKIDGAVDEAAWDSVPTINGSFRFPWEEVEAPKTVFRAFHNDVNFYFSFVCDDAQVLAHEKFNGERATVDDEDRVELFFTPALIDRAEEYALPTYFAVEVDALGRVHDYSIKFYRAEMDSAWNMPGLKAAGKLIPNGYSVEGMIPLAELKKLGLIADDDPLLLVGVFRAEFNGDVEKPKDIVQRWISWVDPNTDVPDFHVDEAFGVFRFLK